MIRNNCHNNHLTIPIHHPGNQVQQNNPRPPAALYPVDIAAYGWEFVSGAGCVQTPRVVRGPAAPPSGSLVVRAKLQGELAAVIHVAVI